MKCKHNKTLMFSIRSSKRLECFILLGPYDGTCSGTNDGVDTWVSSICLPENECLNGHHDCNENETCVDLDVTYKCECSPGYERM